MTVRDLSPLSDTRRIWFNHVTSQIIACSHRVGNYFGPGFAERIYVRSLVLELQKNGLEAVREHEVDIHYHDALVGKHRLDLVVENAVVVEAKAVSQFPEGALVQLKHYLVATGYRLGLAINFGSSVVVRRSVNHF